MLLPFIAAAAAVVSSSSWCICLVAFGWRLQPCLSVTKKIHMARLKDTPHFLSRSVFPLTTEDFYFVECQLAVACRIQLGV